MKRKNKNNGITLIALIITIIVMLILVGVSISMVVNGGLFEYAGKAVGDTETEKKKEEEIAAGGIEVDGVWYASLEDVANNKPAIRTYEETGKENGVLKANAYWIERDNEGNETARAVVPKGFAVVAGINGSKKISEGLVITDEVDEDGKSIGNEFVWIPVTYTKEGTLDEDGYDTGFKKVFYRSTWANNGRDEDLTNSTAYAEPYAKGYSDGNGTEEAKEYKEMLDSVYQNDGFYIGRYEAGIKTTTGSARISSTTGTTTNWVVQKNCYPYTYVGWGSSISNYTDDVGTYGNGALYLSKAMYKNKKVGVTSTLCYGVMWDAMLDFIKDSEHNVTNSRTWGNYKNNLWTIKNTSAMYSEDNGKTWLPINDQKTKNSSTSILLTTGADDSFAAKNIYDVAGNVYEWTNEAYSANKRVNRGGASHSNGGDGPASFRYGYYPYYCDGHYRL